MAEPYTTVVGLEVHVQLLTRTKLFCGCLNRYGLPPNTANGAGRRGSSSTSCWR